MSDSEKSGIPGRRALVAAVGACVCVAVLAAAFLRKPATEPVESPKAASSGSSSKDAYQKVTASRQELVRQLLVALRSAAATPNREDTVKASSDLVREGAESVPQVLSALKEDRLWNYRMALLSVLARIPELNAVAALEEFYGTLKSEELAAKLETARGLGRSGNRPAREALLRILAKESDEKVREEIRRILIAGGLRPEELTGLQKRERDLLEKDVLAKNAQRSRIEELEKLDPRVEASMPALRRAVLEEATIGIATLAFRKMELRADEVAVDLLAQRAKLRAETPEAKIIQTNALASLSRMRIIPARTAVRGFAMSEDPDLRRQAISLIGAFGDEAMLPVLEDAARTNASAETRKIVDEAIQGIRTRASSKGSASKEGS